MSDRTDDSDPRTRTGHRYAPLHGIAPPAMPYSIRVLLENVLRRPPAPDRDAQIAALLDWEASAGRGHAIDLFPSRIFLHDTNGVPTLVDLAGMRDATSSLGGDPAKVNPHVPAELVIDHSVIADVFGTGDAFERNVDIEFDRNAERYRFLRWGQSSVDQFSVVPPGTGIMHQINIEYLARVVTDEDGWLFPDVCLGTDSHTTMVNGVGVLGWGIGGIEAEAVMLGEPFSMPVPDVLGFRLTGALPPGATATDLVLTVTEVLREYGVVGKFVEFHGPGVSRLRLADRATIANMSPEFGSTVAYFPIDAETIRYLRFTGRDDAHVELVETYARLQGLWHDPDNPPHYTEVIELDLGRIVPSVAGPRRPQDRVALDRVKSSFHAALEQVNLNRGSAELLAEATPTIGLATGQEVLRHGSVAIAAITSCTNTSNPAVMVAAALVARNAVERGLASKPWVKTTLSPGSRVVTDYIDAAGLTTYFDQLGFTLTGYGCMTCIGASGPLIDEVQDAVREHDVTVAAVLSGNRNFDGRINPDVRMNYLASPPLVVAYALAGTIDFDFASEPLGQDPHGTEVFLADLWPSDEEIDALVAATIRPAMFSDAYASVFNGNARWNSIDVPSTPLFDWDPASTYIRRPPYLDDMDAQPAPLHDLGGMRVLAKLGDQITTDHLSPAGAIPAHTPAGTFLMGQGVQRFELNTYASRRGNHEVMMRGTLANVRLRNHLTPELEGGFTLDFTEPDPQAVSIFDAATAYRQAGTPLLILGGRNYGAGSSRDWAAKGPALLGVRVVLAESFERIHRSNLVGMGILPLQFPDGTTAESLGLSGRETYAIQGLGGASRDNPVHRVTVTADQLTFTVDVRLDTPREWDYYVHGGIMKYVLRRLL